MNETVQMTITYDEPDEDGWIVARRRGDRGDQRGPHASRGVGGGGRRRHREITTSGPLHLELSLRARAGDSTSRSSGPPARRALVDSALELGHWNEDRLRAASMIRNSGLTCSSQKSRRTPSISATSRR